MKFNYRKITGSTLILIGIAGLFICWVAVGMLSEHSLWFLHRLHAPKAGAGEDYLALYRYAEDITQSRNNHFRALVVVLWTSVAVLGGMIYRLGHSMRDK